MTTKTRVMFGAGWVASTACCILSGFLWMSALEAGSTIPDAQLADARGNSQSMRVHAVEDACSSGNTSGYGYGNNGCLWDESSSVPCVRCLDDGMTTPPLVFGSERYNYVSKTCAGPRAVGICDYEEGTYFCRVPADPVFDGTCSGSVGDTTDQ